MVHKGCWLVEWNVGVIFHFRYFEIGEPTYIAEAKLMGHDEGGGSPLFFSKCKRNPYQHNQ